MHHSSTGALPILTLEQARTAPIADVATFYLRCTEAYFNTDTSVVDDAAFDELEDVLRQRAPNHPALEVTGAQTGSHEKVELPVWMGSQNKIYPDSHAGSLTFKAWQKQVGNDTAIATAKLDGLSAMLEITPTTAHLYSRGDGKHATDWTAHLHHMTHLRAPIQHVQTYLEQHSDCQRVLLRGEAIMSYKNYAKHQATEEWTSTARNVVSGLFNAKASSPRLLRCVDIVFYEVVEPPLPSFIDQLEWLHTHQLMNVAHSLGKRSNKSTLSADFTLADLEPLFWSYREHCPYATDGVVVQCSTPHTRNTKGNPNYAFAFKIRVNDASQVAETTVVNVEWNMSRHGRLKPTVVLEPVTIANVTIERTTGFHYKFVVENGVGKGAVVQIRRCGDVIPNIVSVKKPAKAKLPDVPFTLTKTGVDALAVNIKSSKDYQTRKLAHFFKVMDVPRMSEKTVKKFVEHHHSTAFDILGVGADTMQTWDGFATKSSEQLAKDMRRCTHEATALQWIHAGAVFGEGIGQRHLEHLLPNAPLLFRTHPLTASQRTELRVHLLSLNGYQNTTVDHLLNHHDDFVNYWKLVTEYMKGKPPPLVTPTKQTKQDLAGKVYCFTDVRDKNMEKALQSRGAKIATSMSKKVDVLICGDVKGNSSKLMKARALQADGGGVEIRAYEK